MKYKEIDYNKLEAVIKCLSQTCKYKSNRTGDKLMSTVWDEIPDYSDSIIEIVKNEVSDIPDKEILDKEFAIIIALSIFIAISLAQDEILESLNNNIERNGRMSMWDILKFIEGNHNKFYKEICMKILDDSFPILLFALVDEGFVDGSKGGDKSVNYNSLHELLEDVIVARFSLNDNNKEIWKAVKEVIPKAMDIIKTHFRTLEVSEKIYPTLFANSLISSIVTGTNICIISEKIGIENIASTKSNDIDSFKNFDLIKEVLFPPISWWIMKEFGEEIKETNIVKTPRFNPSDYGWKDNDVKRSK